MFDYVFFLILTLIFTVLFVLTLYFRILRKLRPFRNAAKAQGVLYDCDWKCLGNIKMRHNVRYAPTYDFIVNGTHYKVTDHYRSVRPTAYARIKFQFDNPDTAIISDIYFSDLTTVFALLFLSAFSAFVFFNYVIV